MMQWPEKCRECKNEPTRGIAKNTKKPYRTCEACRSRRHAYAKTIRNNRAKKGLCAACGKPARPGLTTCQGCASRAVARYEYRVNNGLCTNCSKPFKNKGKTWHAMCSECRKKSRDRYAEMRQQEERIKCMLKTAHGA